MEFKELCQLFEKCDYTVRSYSGRGMNGKTCLAVESGDNNLILDVIHELCVFNDDSSIQLGKVQEVAEMLRDARTDSMGKGEITYWPNIKWENSLDDMED